MKYKLPRLTRVAAAIWLCWLAASGTRATAADVASGNELLTRAAAHLQRQPSLEAKLRQRVALFDQYLVGSGVYQQLIVGRRRMLRFELKLQVADRLTSLQQISDGTILWIRRDSGASQSLGFVNLPRLRQGLVAAESLDPAPPLGADWMALGGLHQLLDGLNRHFVFSAPRPAQIDSVPTWEITGRWKPEVLKRLLPGSPSGPPPGESLPPQLPTTVTLALGRDNQLPLFPYRIEYKRRAAAGLVGQPPRDRPIVTMELFEVRRRPDLQPHHFSYQAQDQEVEDRTDEFLRRLGVGDQPAP